MDCLDFLFTEGNPVPSPCFVLDEPRLAANAAILDQVQRRTGARILLALKGYAAWRPRATAAGRWPRPHSP